MRSRYERLEQTNRELVEQLRVLQSTLDEGVATEENVEEIINITDIPSEGDGYTVSIGSNRTTFQIWQNASNHWH